MSKLPTRATVSGSTLSGATLKTYLTAVWDALNSKGITDSARSALTTSQTLTVAQSGLVLVDATSGAVTLTLPTSGASTDELVYTIRRTDATTNAVTVQRGGTDTIEAATAAQSVHPGGLLGLQMPAGSTDWRITQLAGATSQAARNMQGLGDLSSRNKIPNGDMAVAQNGTSFSGVTNGTYTLDGWYWASAGVTSSVTVSRQTDVPSNNEFQYSLRAAVTTADASIAAGDVAAIVCPIEGYDVRDLIGRAFVLRFHVRSTKTGTHCVAFSNSGADRSYVATYTVNAANTWEEKTVVIPVGLITAGTWDWTNGVGLLVRFVLAAGSTYQTTAGAWQTGNFYATSGQVNCLDSNSNIFAVAGVQPEPGAVPTPFEHRPYSLQLLRCQRYFEPFYAALECAIAPSGTRTASFNFRVPKRAAPSISWGTTVLGTPSVGTVSVNSVNISNTTGNFFVVDVNASARL